MTSTSEPEPCSASRPQCRLQWSDSDMRAAMEAVSGGKMNTNAAAKSFGVPRKTLDTESREK